MAIILVIIEIMHLLNFYKKLVFLTVDFHQYNSTERQIKGGWKEVC